MNAAPIERPASRDRFHPSYVISAFLFVLYCDVLLTLSRTTGDDAIAFFLVLLPGTLTLIVWLCCTGWILAKRHWRRAVSLFAAPLLALMPFQALGHFGIDGDWLRFEYEKPGFLKGVAESVAFNGHPVLIHWFWGMVGGGFGTSAQIWILIYDETDQLSLPSKSWSDEYRSKIFETNAGDGSHATYMQGSGLDLSTGEAAGPYITNMGGHFYLAQFEG
ncbi:hypothetical protein [Rhizobium sp. L51/94]|uniref:hypothetical protein n=1 Tax=Rhizobium sp. L51/94 TaxID=2819999 RepID=UPI001C5B5598|nr:hypothetical protein [Rhizobium sp. L51/94]QXZ80926.1 hypothetical protein J5274_18570 [Rhizobium sp. L51/94]